MMVKHCSLLLLLLVFLGCASKEAEQLPSAELVPAVLDCGDVRMAENPLHVSFSVKNKGNKPVRIEEIGSSCGCTVAKPPDKPILPGQLAIIPVTVNIAGQTGEFRHSLSVRLAGLPEPLPLEVKGNVLNDLRYNPPVVRMTIDTQTGLSQGFFEVYTDKHHDIQFDFGLPPDYIKVREVSRRRLADETVIRLSLEIESQDFESHHKLVLQPLDHTIAPLAVPILCLAAE